MTNQPNQAMEPTASVVEISNIILNAGASGENIFNDGGTVTSLGYNLSSDDGGRLFDWPGRSDQYQSVAWSFAG